jgi:hypothetical protein
MIRRALLLITIAAIYLAIKQSGKNRQRADDHASEAQWANEGGANSPGTV